MTLLEIIRNKKIATATGATVATDVPKLVPTVANVACVAVAKQERAKVVSSITYKQEAAIKTWLSNIGEPEKDHYLVLSKCRKEPEALAYYLERVAESKR